MTEYRRSLLASTIALAFLILAPPTLAQSPPAPPTSKGFCCQGQEFGVFDLSGVWQGYRFHNPPVGTYGSAGFLYEGTELDGRVIFEVTLSEQTLLPTQLNGGQQVRQTYNGTFIETWFEYPNRDPMVCLPAPQASRNMCGYVRRFASYDVEFSVRWCKASSGFVFSGLNGTEMNLLGEGGTDSRFTLPERMVINPVDADCPSPSPLNSLVTFDYEGNLMVSGFGPGGEVTFATNAPNPYDEIVFRPGDRDNCWCEAGGTNLPVNAGLARRSGAASIADLKAPLRFTISSDMPLDLVESEFRPMGQFNVLRQLAAVRDRQPGETDMQWQAYLQSINDSFEFIDAVPRFENGEFIVDDLPLFDSVRVGDRNTFRPARYALRLRGLNAEEFIAGSMPLMTRFTVFTSADAFNLEPGTLTDLTVSPVDAIPVKRNLIDELSQISAQRYLPIENLALAHLNSLETGGITEAELEGLNRAILAERTVRDGARFGEQMIASTLSNLGDLLASLVDEVLSRVGTGKALKDKKDELDRIKNGLDADALRNAGWQGVPADAADIESAISDLIESNFDLKLSLVTEKIKYFVGVGLSGLKSALIAGGLDSDTTNLVVTVFETVINTTLDIMVEQGLGAINSAAQEAVKLAVKSGQDELFNDLPSSYTDLTDEALDFSRVQFEAWGVDDDPAYRLDRRQVEAELVQLGVDAAFTLSASTGLSAISDGFGTVVSTLGDLGGKLPVLNKVKLLAKIGKFLTSTASVVVPFKGAFFDNPGRVHSGVARSYGQTAATAFPPSSGKRQATANKGTGLGTLTTNQLRADLQSLRNQLIALENAWISGNLGQVLSLLDASASDDLPALLATIEQDVADVLAIGATATDPNTTTTAMQNAFFNAALGLDEAGATVLALNLDLLGRILTGSFAGPGDVRYLASRDQLLAALDRLDNFANGLRDAATIYRDTVRFLSFASPVVARDIGLVSQASGNAMVRQSGEVFTLTAAIRNLGDAAVSGVEAELTLPVNAASATVQGNAIQAVGALAANDGAPGAGTDQATVTWQLQFTGAVDDQLNIPLRIETRTTAGNDPGRYGTTYAVLSVDPEIFDPDGDTMPTAWENDNGLDPGQDDGEADADSDRVSNADEFALGLMAQVADSDGDGVNDGDELEGINGWATDPARADTDGDGTDDGADGSPLDPTTTAAATAPDPVVQVAPGQVTLNADQPLATVQISNAGTGTLLWRVESANPALVRSGSTEIRAGASLSLALAPGVDPAAADGQTVEVMVSDALGAVADAQVITVTIGTPPDLIFGDGFE